MPITRRDALFTAAAGLAACATPDADEPSLNTLARAKGMRFGAAMGNFNDRSPFSDPRYRAIVEAECGVLVAENEHKWPFNEPAEGQYDYARADAMMAWSEARGIPFRGHTLVWHHPRWLPGWVNNYDFGPRPAEAAERLLRTRISSICARYRGRITSWDVINETVDEHTGQQRETVFTRHLGARSNDVMFQLAREALPDAELAYNDYMGWGDEAAHRNGVLRLLEGFRARNVPVDALGLQSHLRAESDWPATIIARQETWRRFLDEVTGMGYRLLITELDVNDRALPADTALRDRTLADYQRAYLDVTFDYLQLRDALVWGMVDSYSWLQGFTPRADNLLNRANLYDENFQPKLMRASLADAFRAARAR